jgi:hypothetical protein
MAIFLAFKGTRKMPGTYFTVDQILGGGYVTRKLP